MIANMDCSAVTARRMGTTTLAASAGRRSGFVGVATESNFERAAKPGTGLAVAATVASNWRDASAATAEERSSAVAETAASTRRVAEARTESNSRLVVAA